MTNYDMDQLRREGKVPDLDRKADYDGCLGQTDIQDEIDLSKRAEFAQDLIDTEKETTVTIDLDIADEDFVHLAKAAHERNITLNQLCIDVLTSSFGELDYRFEHQSKPSVLKEY